MSPDGAQLYREGTKWTKGHLYALMGHLAFHIRAHIVTVEPENCPREPFSLPQWGTVKGGGIGGGGGGERLLHKNSKTQMGPFF